DLLSMRANACPNLVMVKMADRMLKRHGALLKAVMEHEDIVRHRMESDKGRRLGMEDYWEQHPEKRPPPRARPAAYMALNVA
ncbi:MAG TPA: hypothetical protein VHB73_06975, partial [Alphaproteobacteria bacterium]|nr:hypothetical protein [Alphaproteobacteria bacterium]